MNLKELLRDLWRVICSYIERERSGQNRGVTLATLKNVEPAITC
jgi:hypothetical protein